MITYNSAFLDELRSKIDIVDVASRYLTLNRRGGSFWACCPFHNEKTASFHVQQEGQFFKCFGCGESGNVFNFIMKMENLDFPSSVEYLCKMYNIEPPTQQDNDQFIAKKKEKDLMFRVLKCTTEFYHKNLINNPNSPQAQYVKQRKINNEMIQKFQIGASLNFDDLPKYLKAQGFSAQDMLTAGVVGQSDDGRLYDFYGRRVIFPIFNGFGDAVGYSGRSVEASPDHTKYKNTNQTAIFNKSEILFAYNFVRGLKKEKLLDTIIIVEGHIDVIACHQVGITNTVGCMGTALTQQHARKIKQLVDNVIVCLDGDSAGESATYKAIEVLKGANLNVKVVRLTRAKDPDEFLSKFGKDAFMDMLSQAMDCVDFILIDKAKKYDLTINAQKTRYVDEAISYISKFSTPAEQEIYLKMVQQMVKIPIDSLRKTLENAGSGSTSKQPQQEEEPTEIVSNKNILDSKIMILASIIYKKLENFENFSGLFDADDELSKLYKYVANKLQNKQTFVVSSLFDEFDIKNNSLVDKVINYSFPPDEIFVKQLQDAEKQVQKFQLKQQWDKVKQQMMSAQTQQEQYKYLTELQEITKRINEIK